MKANLFLAAAVVDVFVAVVLFRAVVFVMSLIYQWLVLNVKQYE